MGAPVYRYSVPVRGQLAADQADRIMGGLLTCRGIHLPKDPSPRKLKGLAREVWRKAYDVALRVYSGNEKVEELASKTAWKTVRLFFLDPTKAATFRPALPKPGFTPRSELGVPGELVQLGYLLEYTYIDGLANLVVVDWKDDPPRLYWDDEHRTLYIFPGAQVSDCQRPAKKGSGGLRRLYKLFVMWAQRKPKCEFWVDVPDPNTPMELVGQLDTEVYRSDKWHNANPEPSHQGSQEYIHQHGDGVSIWSSTDPQNPAIAIMGGCLDVESRGIIH
jgi:hypothetical protein